MPTTHAATDVHVAGLAQKPVAHAQLVWPVSVPVTLFAPPGHVVHVSLRLDEAVAKYVLAAQGVQTMSDVSV